MSSSESRCVWAVVPAKTLARAKSRLHPALPHDARRQLARALLERALDACRNSHAFAATLVATDGDDTAALAQGLGADVLRDARRGESLAAIVDAALAYAEAHGATHAVVAMADLPLIRARDLVEVTHALLRHDVVIVPDPQRRGTSALGLRLAGRPRTQFGRRDSFALHVARSLERASPPRVLSAPRLSRDFDEPDDAVRGINLPYSTP